MICASAPKRICRMKLFGAVACSLCAGRSRARLSLHAPEEVAGGSFFKNCLTEPLPGDIMISVPAGMAELADALDSGSSESNFMQVQVLFPAPQPDLLIGLFLTILGNCVKNRAASTERLNLVKQFGSGSGHRPLSCHLVV